MNQKEYVDAYRQGAEDERKRVIELLRTIRTGSHWVGRDFAITLIKGDTK